MPTFKLVVPSKRTANGWETTRWNVRRARESITYDQLVMQLRKIIDVPTSGYAVTWSDGEDNCSIHSTEDLQEAIEFFETHQTMDNCIRLRAEPIDTLDLFTALELFPQLNSAEVVVSTQLNCVETNKPTELCDESSCNVSDGVATNVGNTVALLSQQCHISNASTLSIHVNESVTIEPEPSFNEIPKIITIQERKGSRSVFPIIRESRSKRVITPSDEECKLEAIGTADPVRQQLEEEHRNNALSNAHHPVHHTAEEKTEEVPDAEIKAEQSSDTWVALEDVYTLSRQLYMMGFHFDESVFKQTIRECNGDVNLIIDKLSKRKEQ